MNIVFTGNFLGRGWDGSITDENHISDALGELGHTVYKIQREDHSVLPDFDYVETTIDFVLISQYDQYPVDWVPRLKEQYRCPVVLWCFDYQADGQPWHELLISQADLYLSKRIADSKYPNWQWLSQDFAPSFLDKYPLPVEKDIDVLFTGSYLPWATERNETIKTVNDNSKLEVYSVNDWPFLERKPPRMDHDLPKLYARAKVILSIDHTIEAGYHSDRNAQIIACGERPLFRYIPMSEAVFHDDVDYFYSIEDCLKKIQNRLDGVAKPHNPPNIDNYKVNSRVRDLLVIIESIMV